MSRPQGVQMPVRERPGLDLEPIAPVAVPQALPAVAREGQSARLPLFEHVTVLVQHEPRVIEELLRGAAQVNAPPAGGGDGAQMQPRVEGALDDADLGHGLAEHALQRPAEGIRQGDRASDLHDLVCRMAA